MNKDLKMKTAFTLAEGATHVGIFHNIGGTLHKFVESFTHVGIFHNIGGTLHRFVESFTHVGIFHITRRVAFTLAEVLITLGIIGIVSAMTIPTLVKNYQKKVLNNQFMQTYAILSQALRLTTSQIGYMPKCYYKSSATPVDYSGCKEFWKIFYSNLKVSKICEENALELGCIAKYRGIDTIINEQRPDAVVPDGYENIGQYQTSGCAYWRENRLHNDIRVLVLNSGVSILEFVPNKHQHAFPLIAVDINGKSAPNKWGYDLFEFALEFDGNKYTMSNTRPHICMSAVETGGTKTLQKLQELGLK